MYYLGNQVKMNEVGSMRGPHQR